METLQSDPKILLTDIRQHHLRQMQKTVATIGYILTPVTQEVATTLRDGPDGWTVLEVLGHLRDFDAIFRQRAQMMLAQDYPDLPAYDHEQMAIDYRYNEQNLKATYQALLESRQETSAFFAALSDTDWERAGVHPERGHFPMTVACIQVSSHDLTHIEQIAKILTAA